MPMGFNDEDFVLDDDHVSWDDTPLGGFHGDDFSLNDDSSWDDTPLGGFHGDDSNQFDWNVIDDSFTIKFKIPIK